MSDSDTGRLELAQGTRILARHKLIGMFGHVSIYGDPKSDRYLLGPGAGFRKDLCGPEDIFEVGFEDEWRPGLPLEIYMHAEAHRAKPDVGCLVHLHSPALTRLSVWEEVPDHAYLLHSAFWPAHVPVYEGSDLIRDRDSARELVALLRHSPLVLLRWHGAMIAGSDIREAIYLSINAELNALMILDTQGKRGKHLPSNTREELHSRIVNERLLDLYWSYETSFLECDRTSDGGADGGD